MTPCRRNAPHAVPGPSDRRGWSNDDHSAGPFLRQGGRQPCSEPPFVSARPARRGRGTRRPPLFTESTAPRDRSSSPREPSALRTRRCSFAQTPGCGHSVKRRCAVAPDGPKTGGSCRQVQPVVATTTIAARTSRSLYRRRPPAAALEQTAPHVETAPTKTPAPTCRSRPLPCPENACSRQRHDSYCSLACN